MRAILLFPPSWTLATGSPHAALPTIKAFLEQSGIESKIRDVNWDVATELHAGVDISSAKQACNRQNLEEMNVPFFNAEDYLNEVARQFRGSWNAQLGFEFKDHDHALSQQVFDAIEADSPFSEYFRRNVVPDVLRDQPDVLGLCLASVFQIIPSLQLCGLLRKAGYRGFIVLGGNTVSRLASEMAIDRMFDLADALITFQGEIPLLRLCRALEAGLPLDMVPQLIWRDAERIRRNSLVELPDPNAIPTPDYGDLPIGRYWGANYINIVASRGCYYGKCSFCAIPYGWGNGGFAGIRSPTRVYRDMVNLTERHGINRFKFVDEALSPSFMRALSERIVEDGAKFEWEGYVRLERAWYDSEFVGLVSRAGFRKGYFGLELVPSEQRSALHKEDCPRPEDLLTVCNASGVKVHFFCMFGFPGTAKREAEATTEFLLKHGNDIDTVDIFPWTYTRHTHVEGAEPIMDPQKDWALEFRHRPTRAGVLSSEEVIELAAHYEELLWDEIPRFLHPTYRLVSPWSQSVLRDEQSTKKERIFALS